MDKTCFLEEKDASDISYATKLNLPGKSHLRQYFFSYVLPHRGLVNWQDIDTADPNISLGIAVIVQLT